MIFSEMSSLRFTLQTMTAGLLMCATFAYGDKKAEQTGKRRAGPRAAALRVTWLYITPDKTAQKTGRVQIGREMVVAEKSGPWLRVYANTDVEELESTKVQPVFATNDTPPP